MTHWGMYKRGVNPQLGLLLDGRERERDAERNEGGEKTEEQEDSSC